MDPFAKACKDAAKDLRKMPKDLQKELKVVVSRDVADWLMGRMKANATGRDKKLTFKVRKGLEPTIAVGGSSSIVSGGAAGRQLVYGDEFGGGKRLRAKVGEKEFELRGQVRTKEGVRRRVSKEKLAEALRRRGHRVTATTLQFPNPPKHPFIYPTIKAEWQETSERWIAALDPILERWEQGA